MNDSGESWAKFSLVINITDEVGKKNMDTSEIQLIVKQDLIVVLFLPWCFRAHFSGEGDNLVSRHATQFLHKMITEFQLLTLSSAECWNIQSDFQRWFLNFWMQIPFFPPVLLKDFFQREHMKTSWQKDGRIRPKKWLVFINVWKVNAIYPCRHRNE